MATLTKLTVVIPSQHYHHHQSFIITITQLNHQQSHFIFITTTKLNVTIWKHVNSLFQKDFFFSKSSLHFNLLFITSIHQLLTFFILLLQLVVSYLLLNIRGVASSFLHFNHFNHFNHLGRVFLFSWGFKELCLFEKVFCQCYLPCAPFG